MERIRSVALAAVAAIRRHPIPAALATWVVVVVALVTGAIVPLALAAGFPDVPANSPYRTAIADLSSKGIIGGYAGGNFGPGDPVTRQQFAKMVVKALGLPVLGGRLCPFTDVSTSLDPNDPFYPDKYVTVCASTGITKGKTPTAFNPTAPIKREQLISMVTRAAGAASPPAGYEPDFSVAQFSLEEHFQNARAAASMHLLDGLAGLGPGYDFKADASRGECAQVLYNLMRYGLSGGEGTAEHTVSLDLTVSASLPSGAWFTEAAKDLPPATLGRSLDIGITEYLPAGPVQISESDTSKYADIDFLIHYADVVCTYAQQGLDVVSSWMFANTPDDSKCYVSKTGQEGLNYPVHEQLAQHLAGSMLDVTRSEPYGSLKAKVYACEDAGTRFLVVLNKDAKNSHTVRVVVPGEYDLVLTIPARSYTSLLLQGGAITVSGTGA